VVDLVSKVPYHKIRAGDRIVAHGPSGGGYGNPLLREAQAVLGDVLDGYLTAEDAHAAYGVVITAGAVDTAATNALRERRAGVRNLERDGVAIPPPCGEGRPSGGDA
jgi:N-methylhydantoinase B